MTAAAVQTWVAVLGAAAAAVLGLFRYFSYKSKRDRKAAVGLAFASTVEALASENETRRMAAAVLLRRFFDRSTEQGEAGLPYLRETIEVIAGMLRVEQPERLQKVLADGLRHAGDLAGADLQQCNLRNAFIGLRPEQKGSILLSNADLYKADCTRASFRRVTAKGTVFNGAILERAVLIDADLERADFRSANLTGTRFGGARIGGAQFEGATSVPDEVRALLTDQMVGKPGSVVAKN